MERDYKVPSEIQFKAFENMLEGISVYKLVFNDKREVIDGILEYMNPSTVETMGITPEEAIGKNATELFDPDFIRPFIETANLFFATGTIKRFEIFYPPTNKYFLVSGFQMHDNLFAVLRVDITEQKQSQNALRQSEERYHSLFKNNHAVMLLIDPENGDIVDANPAASSFYGYSKEELTKFKITGINALSRQEVFKKMKQAESMKKSHFLFKHRLSNGEIKDVEVYSGPITVENQKLIYSIVHDVTKQKKAQEHEKELLENTRQFAEELEASNEELQATTEELRVSNEELKTAQKTLRQSQKLLQDVIDGYPSIIFVKDVEGHFIIVNHKLEQLLGIKKEELEGKTDYDIFSKEEAGYYREHDLKVLEEGIPIQFEEVANLVDGHYIFLANKFPLYDVSGKPYGVGSISIDITERKHLEEELRHARDNLQEQVEERTAEIEEAYNTLKENENHLKEVVNELKRSNEELQSFAYITSHDLQEPLRTIASYAGLIERRYKGQLDNDADEFLDYMISAAKRMKEMIQGLLDYSRVGTRGGEFVKTDMNICLEKSISNLKSSIDESNAKVTHGILPHIIVDPNQMIRVFQNLISNAIKFKRPNTPPKIHISANIDTEKHEWVFSVSDNSIGMEEQYTDHIFEIFKRLHTIDEYEGTGIGLAVVKRIIDRHGGRVWVESELNIGSTFYFTLPSIVN